jgi:hypothetical protein
VSQSKRDDTSIQTLTTASKGEDYLLAAYIIQYSIDRLEDGHPLLWRRALFHYSEILYQLNIEMSAIAETLEPVIDNNLYKNGISFFKNGGWHELYGICLAKCMCTSVRMARVV